MVNVKISSEFIDQANSFSVGIRRGGPEVFYGAKEEVEETYSAHCVALFKFWDQEYVYSYSFLWKR